MNSPLAAVLAASSDAILSYAMDATILTWNPAAERMFGYSTAEMLGQSMARLVPPERGDEPATLFARLGAGETIRDFETVRMRKDGSRFPVRANLAPIREPDGTISGVSATLCDLSERERAEERFRSLLDAAPDPILGVNAVGRIVFANRQTERVFGYRAAELVGQSIELLVPDRFRERHQNLRATYDRTPVTRPMGVGMDLMGRRRDGSEFPTEISLSPMADATGPVFVAIVRDITERKRTEADRARERAEIERLKDDLSSMIVHDLKNPVYGIFMTLQAMLRSQETSERQRRSLATIEQTCREMLRLVENLLEVAKIESGKMPFAREVVDVANLVEEVAREYGPIAEQADKRLVVALGGALPPAAADTALVKRVLVNLVVNALRHSGAREVRVDAEPGDGEVALRIVDDGRGIPAADHARVFEKFASVRRSLESAPVRDTGLGLPFCKLAVEGMGGRISLSSGPGLPTVFAVTLPVHEA